jgi:hypothetical protein
MAAARPLGPDPITTAAFPEGVNLAYCTMGGRGQVPRALYPAQRRNGCYGAGL